MTDRRTAPEMAETPMGRSWARLQALLPYLPAPVPPPSLDGCPCDPVSGQCIMSEPDEPLRVSRRPRFLRGWGHHDESGITHIRS